MGIGPKNPRVSDTSQLEVLSTEVDQLVLVELLVPVELPPDTCVTCCVGDDDPASNTGRIDPPLEPVHDVHAGEFRMRVFRQPIVDPGAGLLG